MRGTGSITVSDTAVRQARQYGFWGDPAARVRGLAEKATRIDHPAGNSTYGPFILNIQAGHVLSITMTGPAPRDDRPVSACKLCKGLMAYPYRTTLEGREGIAYRPCPRAFDPNHPLCDTKEKTK